MRNLEFSSEFRTPHSAMKPLPKFLYLENFTTSPTLIPFVENQPFFISKV